MRFALFVVGAATILFSCGDHAHPSAGQGLSVRAAASQPVTWGNVVNASASGGTLSKNAGCDGCDDSGGAAQPALTSGNGFIAFSVGNPSSFMAVGLASAPTTKIATIPQQIRFNGGYAEVYENGAWKADASNVTPNDVFQISVSAGTVTYSRNGATFFSSPLLVAYPIVFDASLGSLTSVVVNATTSGCAATSCAAQGKNCGSIPDGCGGTLNCGSCTSPATCGGGGIPNVCGGGGAGPVVWGNVVNASASGGTLSKTAGCDGCDDSGGSAQPPLASGAGWIAFSVGNPSSFMAVGLASAPTHLLAGIPQQIRFNGGYAEVYENGAWKADASNVTTSDVFRISVSSGTVTYSRNGAAFFSSPLLVPYPIVFNASLGSLTSAVVNATTSVSAACVPTSCVAQAKNCGSISDGCGGTLNCGSCTSPQTCGGGGVANVCGGGCVPTSCAAQGKNCGSISDGCGGTLSCGSCASPQTCGGGGVSNVCGGSGGGSPPMTYSAYSGTDYKPIPPAPSLGPANYQFNDPTFGSRMLRVTDANTNAGESFISEYAGVFRTFNANTTAIKVLGPHGDGYWLEFNASSFAVGDGSSRPVIHQAPLLNWQWSAVNPDLIYGFSGNGIAVYDKATGATTPLVGPPTGDPVAYSASVVGADDWICSTVNVGGGEIQDTFTGIFCVQPSNPSNYRYVDVVHRTINGVPQSDPNWPTGSGIGIHGLYGGEDSTHIYVDFHGGNWGGNGDSVFNINSGTWSLLGNGDNYWSGHDSVGNGRFANGAGSQNGLDSRGLLVRDPDHLMDASKYLFVMQPPTTPANGWCDGEHSSWLNSLTNPNVPILDSRYGISANCPHVAWTGEIVAAATDGSNTVWRFAHNHNNEGTGGYCFSASSFAQISNDGRFALFSSPWGGTLGPESGGYGCGVRIDVFIVQLAP